MSEKSQTDQKNHLSQRLRVLVIDDNVVCLEVLAFNLKKCGYRVSKIRDAREAIEMLKKNKDNFDVVLTDVIRSDVDGFEIVKIIGKEIGIPVLMTSANSDVAIIDKGVRHGALDFLVKPVRPEILKNIWQHVVRKSMHFPKGGRKFVEDDDDGDSLSENAKDEAQSTDSSEENENPNPKKRSRGESTSESSKKKRAEWTHELRAKFADVVRRLETTDKVVPKNILKMMNVPNLTRQQVASYLQKFRINEDQMKIEQKEKLRRRLSESAMYSLTQNSAPFPSVYPQIQPRQHQSLPYSDQNMISQGNSDHISYNPMEIHPQSLNLPSHFSVLAPSSSVDGISSYCDWQNNVGMKMEQPYPPRHSRSSFIGDFPSPVILPSNNVIGSTQGFTSNVESTQGFTSQGAPPVVLNSNNVGISRGFSTQRPSVILPNNNVGSAQMKSEQVPAGKVHSLVSPNVVSTPPNYLPVSYEQRKSLVAVVDPQMNAIPTNFPAVGITQTPNGNLTFKSGENMSNVFNQTSIFDEDNFIVPSEDMYNDLDAVIQGFSDHVPSLCDETEHWSFEWTKDA